MKGRIVKGYSKLSEDEKRRLAANLAQDPDKAAREMEAFLFTTPGERELFMDLSENTVSSYHLPYGIAPNFVINDKVYHVPMVIEESSVVAAAASAARFWSTRGGFRVKSISTEKLGHVFFRWFSDPEYLSRHWPGIEAALIERLSHISDSMERRGGGVMSLTLMDMRSDIDYLWKIEAVFDTVDSMGANFINTCLEEMALGLRIWFDSDHSLEKHAYQVVMSILSNYAHRCTVTVEAACSLEELEGSTQGLNVEEYVDKMLVAYQIARTDVFRATTHNKGIMNGIDAVLIATGNDFRAAEAAAHAYASRDGQYRGLSYCRLEGEKFIVGLTLPLAIGTVGGITTIHPLARTSMEILGNPGAGDLMGIVASVGLASNFSAVQSLVTTGIQKGHMKLHLVNILNTLNASVSLRNLAQKHFSTRKVSYAAVKEFLDTHDDKTGCKR